MSSWLCNQTEIYTEIRKTLISSNESANVALSMLEKEDEVKKWFQDNEALGPDSENTWAVDDTDFAELFEKYGYRYEPGNIDELYKIIADEKGITLEELKELLGECFGQCRAD